jgi:hypothetical protein
MLLEDIAAGIRVLQTRDGIALSDDQILERARNIVAGLIGNYQIRSLEAHARAAGERVVRQHQLDLLERAEQQELAETREEQAERLARLERINQVGPLGRRGGRPARA